MQAEGIWGYIPAYPGLAGWKWGVSPFRALSTAIFQAYPNWPSGNGVCPHFVLQRQVSAESIWVALQAVFAFECPRPPLQSITIEIAHWVGMLASRAQWPPRRILAL